MLELLLFHVFLFFVGLVSLRDFVQPSWIQSKPRRNPNLETWC